MAGQFDLDGMFTALERAVVPDPLDPLRALDEAAATVRDRMRVFDPACTSDAALLPVAPRGRRPGR